MNSLLRFGGGLFELAAVVRDSGNSVRAMHEGLWFVKLWDFLWVCLTHLVSLAFLFKRSLNCRVFEAAFSIFHSGKRCRRSIDSGCILCMGS
ncbi:hypothetical protein J2Z65_005812 [Paenibacillus aceris]|uniref:Uncharacterized protein n=1 Tax=Paenibacillus aceris TaxID=869555 RepID=A0ABS4I6L4_9BACL|nr:hypothetical protein [Paenibacillus aceris]